MLIALKSGGDTGLGAPSEVRLAHQFVCAKFRGGPMFGSPGGGGGGAFCLRPISAETCNFQTKILAISLSFGL